MLFIHGIVDVWMYRRVLQSITCSFVSQMLWLIYFSMGTSADVYNKNILKFRYHALEKILLKLL